MTDPAAEPEPRPDIGHAPPIEFHNETSAARVVLANALRRYGRASNPAEMQLAVLALYEGVRQVMRVWLLHQDYLTQRQHDSIANPYTRLSELIDLARHHTDLFSGRRSAWDDELAVLVQHRNAIAHPVDDVAPDTALAAATGWADLVRRLWPVLIGGDPPDLRHPDPAAVKAAAFPPHPRLTPPTAAPKLSFYTEPTREPFRPPRRPPWRLLISIGIVALFASIGLLALSLLLSMLPRF